MNPDPRLPPGLCAQIACLLEASAPKAGNVRPGRGFPDASYVDFLVSAAAIGPAMELAPARGIGETVLDAIERTRSVVSSNTNLGIVLLLAPLAAVHGEADLEEALRRRLAAATVGDAELVYRAIRLAAPGGLGEVPREDVRGDPTLPLAEVMALAADRDLVARQYRDVFADVRGLGVRALVEGLASGLSVEEAVVRCHLRLMASLPDSLIRRKAGDENARRASRLAAGVLANGWPREERGRSALEDLDRWLRSRGNLLNPGATADLTAAACFVALREGVVSIPFPRRG